MDANKALRETERMREEVQTLIDRIEMEESDPISEGFDPEDCRGLARRVKRELKDVFKQLRTRQRVVPCLRNKDVGSALRRFTWPLNFVTDQQGEAAEEILEACKKAMCESVKSNRGEFLFPIEQNHAMWLPMADPTQAVSYIHAEEVEGDNRHIIRFHATSTHAMAKLLQRCGDFGDGARVTPRKVLEFLGVCAHAYAPLPDECDGSSFSLAHDLYALPSAVQGLVGYFGDHNPLRPITNPFASNALVERTSTHFDSVSQRHTLRTLRREVLNALNRLERRVQRMEKGWGSERGTHEYQKAALERVQEQYNREQ